MLPTEPFFTRMLLIGLLPSLFIWLVMAASFAKFVYPSADREFGGGRPVTFELTLAPEDKTVASGTYDVFAVTDRYWVVRNTAANAYFIQPSERVRVARLIETER